MDIQTKAYLGGTVPVQKSLLELRDGKRRYAARAGSPGVPEKTSSRRGQAEMLRENALRPLWRASRRS